MSNDNRDNFKGTDATLLVLHMRFQDITKYGQAIIESLHEPLTPSGLVFRSPSANDM